MAGAGITSSGKDMSRMKAAMLARKADITKAGGMKPQQMLWVYT